MKRLELLKKVKRYLRKNREDIPISLLLLGLTIITVSTVYINNFVFGSFVHISNPLVIAGTTQTKQHQEYYESIEVITDTKESIPFDDNAELSVQKKKVPSFVTIKNRKLVIQPAHSDVGNYNFKVTTDTQKAQIIYHYTVQVILPPVDFQALKKEVKKILGEEIDHYAIAAYDLKRKQGFYINGNVVMRPGSTSKLPYGIIVLRDVDAGKYSLGSVEPYLKRMLQYSDNTAMMHLDNLLGGYQIHNSRVVEELGVGNWFRHPHTCTANDIVKTYKGIYYQKYLSKELNDYLINLLVNAHPGFDNRIKQGIPDTLDVAHKTGYVWTDHGYAYNDTALIFGNKTDFILVILDKDTTPDAAVAMMKPISETVYNELDGGDNPVVLGISSFRYYPY